MKARLLAAAALVGLGRRGRSERTPGRPTHARRDCAGPPHSRSGRQRQDGRDPEREPDRAAERRHRRDDLHAGVEQSRRRRRHERALSEAVRGQAAQDRLPADTLGRGDSLAAADGGDRLDGGRGASGARTAPRGRRDRTRDPGARDPECRAAEAASARTSARGAETGRAARATGRGADRDSTARGGRGRRPGHESRFSMSAGRRCR